MSTENQAFELAIEKAKKESEKQPAKRTKEENNST